MKGPRPPRHVEKWSEIFQRLNLDPNTPINYVTAKEIKEKSGGLEPRIMAKMDSIEDLPNLPNIFRENGLYILPVNRQGYAIVKGKGYHEIEKA